MLVLRKMVSFQQLFAGVDAAHWVKYTREYLANYTKIQNSIKNKT